MTTQPQHNEHHREILDRLVDLGASIAQALHDDITAAASTEPRSELALAFDRVARTVRRTVHLARHLDDPTPNRRPTPVDARKRIIREVEDAIEVETRNPDLAEAQTCELMERLDAPEFDDDLASRPVADIIAEICKDLDIFRYEKRFRFKRRTPQDVENLAARAARRPPPHPTIRQPPSAPPSLPIDPAIAVARVLSCRRP